MKKFCKILVCLILCVFTFSLVACKRSDSFVYPTAADTTIGNGGLAVQKGNYLYFVNGFMSADDQTSKNASYTVGSIIVAKLNSNGELIKDDDDLLNDDYYRTMSDKLCGFEATNLFIYGDYLYFASPCQEDEVDSDGNMEWAMERVDFYRIKLNNSGKVEKIYRTQVYNSNLDYSFYCVDSDVYLVLLESGTSLDQDDKSDILTCVKVGGNSTEIATNVNSVHLENDNSYDAIIYSVSNSTDSVYELYKLNLSSASGSRLYTFDSSVEVHDVVNGYVYITKTGLSQTELLRSSLSGSINFTRVCYSGLYDYVFVTPNAEAVITVKSGTFEFFLYQDTNPSVIYLTDSEASSLTFLGFINGSLIYLDSSNNIKSLSYSEVLSLQTPEIITIATLSSSANTTYFDFEDEYLYFYQTVGDNLYLHRLQINNNVGQTEEMVGVYLEADIPETEEEGDED